ncbi:MAG TPA: hypothetical protein VL461_05090 [Dictyobacter sp.]|jgi:hypothetical protein|nr:hypothetical protein [Dictyobacter sp.]
MRDHETADITEAITAQSTETMRTAWSKFLTPWWQASLAVLPIFLITRVFLLILTHFGGVLFALPNASSFALDSRTVLYSWYHWDAPRYLSIAGQGYEDASYTGLFPLYPVIVHLVYAVTHIDLLVCGLFVSNIAFFGALVLLYRLSMADFSAEESRRGILYLAIFPTALIFFEATAISLLLFWTLLCVYLLRQGNWWLAAVGGAMAALTDLSGALLFILFLCEFWRQCGTRFRQAWKERNGADLGFLSGSACSALLIPLGLGCYAFALSRQFKDALLFFAPQGVVIFVAPWSSLLAALRIVMGTSWYTYAWIHSAFELGIFISCIAVLLFCVRGTQRMPASYWPLLVFSGVLLLYALCLPGQLGGNSSTYDPLPSLQYIVVLLFVIFLQLARWGRLFWVHNSYLIVSLPLFAFLVLQLFTSHWAI